MKLYDHILQGHDATEQNAINHAMQVDWAGIEITEQDKPRHSRFIDNHNGINIYYDYGADYYFFEDDAE